MVKFREAGPGAAYEIAEDADAEKAAELGLAVVEIDPTSGAPTAYGRYKNAPDGAPLGVTVAEPVDTKVVGGGGVPAPVSAPTPAAAPANLNDPIAHNPPGVETIHADGAPPGKTTKELEGVAQPVPEKPTDAKKGK